MEVEWDISLARVISCHVIPCHRHPWYGVYIDAFCVQERGLERFGIYVERVVSCHCMSLVESNRSERSERNMTDIRRDGQTRSNILLGPASVSHGDGAGVNRSK